MKKRASVCVCMWHLSLITHHQRTRTIFTTRERLYKTAREITKKKDEALTRESVLTRQICLIKRNNSRSIYRSAHLFRFCVKRGKAHRQSKFTIGTAFVPRRGTMYWKSGRSTCSKRRSSENGGCSFRMVPPLILSFNLFRAYSRYPAYLIFPNALFKILSNLFLAFHVQATRDIHVFPFR